MARPSKIQIVVLGPMKPDAAGLVPTEALRSLVDDIAARITQAEPTPLVPPARAPGKTANAVIISGVLDLIETADLVVVDLSGKSPEVTYEVGLLHALGMPLVLVTEDPKPPFYLKDQNMVKLFERAAQYDPARGGHRRLYELIEGFLLADDDADRERTYANNAVTEFFELPIIDISAPAGLAAGYWTGSLKRFMERGGYTDLDLARPEGLATLKQRIRTAATAANRAPASAPRQKGPPAHRRRFNRSRIA